MILCPFVDHLSSAFLEDSLEAVKLGKLPDIGCDNSLGHAVFNNTDV